MNFWESLIEQENIKAILIMVLIFGGIIVAQRAHENGKKWARPVQYGLAALFVGLFIWLVIYISG